MCVCVCVWVREGGGSVCESEREFLEDGNNIAAAAVVVPTVESTLTITFLYPHHFWITTVRKKVTSLYLSECQKSNWLWKSWEVVFVSVKVKVKPSKVEEIGVCQFSVKVFLISVDKVLCFLNCVFTVDTFNSEARFSNLFLFNYLLVWQFLVS